jgi:hypothetical protein
MKSAKEKAIEFIEVAGGLIRTNEAFERGIHRRMTKGLLYKFPAGFTSLPISKFPLCRSQLIKISLFYKVVY